MADPIMTNVVRNMSGADALHKRMADEIDTLREATRQAGIPAYAMLDVWMALGGSPASFDRMWGEDRRTPADTWAQILAVVRGTYGALMQDTNPPCGPEFEQLIVKRG